MRKTAAAAALVGAVIGLVLGAGPAAAETTQPGQLSVEGAWEPVGDWPMMPIHMALDSQGRVVSYGTNPDGQTTGRFIYDVWTPTGSVEQNHNTLANTTSTDLFCSLQLNRADTGDMLLFGGDNWDGQNTTNTGNPDINQYSAATQTVSSLPGMHRDRWYATGSTMSDGSIYIQGGDGGADRPEQWSAQGGSQLLDLDTARYDYWYPRNWVAPDGRIFGFDAGYEMYTISSDLERMTDHSFLPFMSDDGRSMTAVMFAPGQILYFGGTTKTAAVIDITGPDPVVTQTGDLTYQRSWGDATVLPDGRVLATGGAARPSDLTPDDPLGTFDVAYAAEIWDPATGQWTVLPAATEARLYHSAAILLPDGRVLTGGGGSPGPVTNVNAEIYQPSYLFDPDGSPAARPSITAVSNTTVRSGETVVATVAHNRPVDRVTLIKTGSVTHSFDMEQRFIEVPFTAAGTDVTFALPISGNVLTPGYYHLFALDDQGVPSESQLLHVEPNVGEALPEIAGGTGGQPFADRPAAASNITAIDLRAGSRVFALQTTTTAGTMDQHGRSTGGSYRVALFPGETITAIFGRAGTFVSSLGFETNIGRTFGPYGGRGGSAATDYRIEAPDGWHVAGFHGREGAQMDGIGIIVQPDGAVGSTPTALGGTISDAGAGDISGIQVDLFNADEFGNRDGWVRSSSTSASGEFRFDVDPGCYAITAIAPTGRVFTNGTAWASRAACVESGDLVLDLDVSLAGPGNTSARLEGTVVTSAGAPVAGVPVDLFTANADGSRGFYLRSSSTGAGGGYGFDVDPDCYVVTFVAPQGEQFVTGSAWFNAGGCASSGQTVTGVDAVLAGSASIGSITGQVADGGGGVAGVQVDVFAANADGSRGQWLRAVTTGPDGQFDAPAPTGCYVLTFIAPDGRTFSNGSPWFNLGTCVVGNGQSSGNNATLS